MTFGAVSHSFSSFTATSSAGIRCSCGARRVAPGHARRQLGFTLLEIMIVTALLAVIAAITIPRLDFRRSDVGVARNELQGLVRVLRVEASATGKPHRLRIDVVSVLAQAQGRALVEHLRAVA